MRSLRNSLAVGLLALALAVSAVPGQAAGQAAEQAAEQAASRPGHVKLFAPATDVTMTVYHYGEDTWTEFNPAVYLKARGTRFEIQLRRPDFGEPVQARVRIGRIDRKIPPRYLDDWNGLRRAFVLEWKRPDGTTLSRRARTWCPNEGQTSRLAPNSAQKTAFAFTCGTHPFTRSMRWGVDRGWARSIMQYGIEAPSWYSGDEMILVFSLRRGLAQIFGIPERERTLRFKVKVKHVYEDPCCEEEGSAPAPDGSGDGTGSGVRSASSRTAHHPPSGPSIPREDVPRSAMPDLISLPAFGISTHSASGKDFLDFGATVYNGGPGPLVAEGFRRGDKAIMDAYQFFYRGEELVDSARVGTMNYDRRGSHQHWHFDDFAKYDLVNKARKRVRTSGKEAFCLAPTDAVDLLARGSVADPGNGDLGTACGDLSSLWVREVLAAGWGDTYTQSRAGQSINITGLRNGTYWIRITANPSNDLYETTRRNNVALRRVIIGGTPGHRTVRVPPVGIIDSEAGLGNFE